MATTKTTTTTDLVARYNKAARTLGRKPVKRFSNKATAVRRVKAIEAELKATKAATTKHDSDVLGAKRGLTFDLPGSKDKVAPREGSRRAALLGTLKAAGKKGISFDKLHAECGFKNRKSTRDALYLLSAKNGYGINGTSDCLHIA